MTTMDNWCFEPCCHWWFELQAWGEKVMKDKSAHAGVSRRAPPCPASMGRVVGKFCFILSSFILRWKVYDDSQHEARCFMLVVNMRLVTCGMIVKKEEFSVQTISHCGLACMIWISAGDFSWSGERVVGLERSTTACRVLIVGRCCQ